MLERLTKDPEKLQKIAEESYKSGAARSGPFTAVMDDFRTLIRLVVAYARGHYREIPADALVVVVAGFLVYVVSPLDLIPDFLPGGFADDAAVVVWVVKSVRSELDNFRAWEARERARSGSRRLGTPSRGALTRLIVRGRPIRRSAPSAEATCFQRLRPVPGAPIPAPRPGECN